MFFIPGEAVSLGPIRQFGRSRFTHGLPNILCIVDLLHIQAKVIITTPQGHAAGTAIDGVVVILQYACTFCDFRRNVSKIPGLTKRLDRRLSQGYAFVIPITFGKLCASDPDQLCAFKISAFRQQHVRHVIGFISNVGKRNHKRKFRNSLRHGLSIPERDGRVRAVYEP